jgi:hypothetical protein
MGACCTMGITSKDGEVPFYKCCFINLFRGVSHDLDEPGFQSDAYGSNSHKSQIRVQNIETSIQGGPCVLNVWKRGFSDFEGCPFFDRK